MPKEERFALSAHLRKTAISIPSNIAEGAARGSDRDFIRFLSYSLASISELETQLIICELIYDPSVSRQLKQLDKLKAQLIMLIKYLKRIESGRLNMDGKTSKKEK